MNTRVTIASITRVVDRAATTDQDLIAAEGPLEIVLAHPAGAAQPAPSSRWQSIGLVMRTPGDDLDLVTGLLVSEQIITARQDILEVRFEPERGAGTDDETAQPARALVTLSASVDLASLGASRVLTRTSACGLCGRLAMQAVRISGGERRPDAPRIKASVIKAIPARLRAGQAVFAETGGLHAAAFCDLSGAPWLLREDVGRHNAVDKVIGAAFAASRLPAIDALLAVSGRVAYEIVQKACAAGVVGIVSGCAVEPGR
jgi:FdhD protein